MTSKSQPFLSLSFFFGGGGGGGGLGVMQQSKGVRLDRPTSVFPPTHLPFPIIILILHNSTHPPYSIFIFTVRPLTDGLVYPCHVQYVHDPLAMTTVQRELVTWGILKYLLQLAPYNNKTINNNNILKRNKLQKTLKK